MHFVDFKFGQSVRSTWDSFPGNCTKNITHLSVHCFDGRIHQVLDCYVKIALHFSK